MTSERRVAGRSGDGFSFAFEGHDIRAWPGESAGAALAAAGQPLLRHAETGGPRRLDVTLMAPKSGP